MCGIFGLVTLDPRGAGWRLKDGGERLENRGPQSIGMATIKDGVLHLFKEAKPPAIACYGLNPETELPGFIGLAHTRYSTTGPADHDSLNLNIQPTVRDGQTLSENGDLVNLAPLRERLQKTGVVFSTQTDAEVIHVMLSQAMRERQAEAAATDEEYAERLFQAIQDIQDQLIGGWSILLLTGRGLLAWRGPRGIRPLMWAVRRQADGQPLEVAFASESSAFNYFSDYEEITDVAAGEAIFVPNNLQKIYQRRLSSLPDKFCWFEWVYFARPDSRFYGRRVEVVRMELGRIVAEENLAEFVGKIDVVIPVPSCPTNAAEAFAQVFGPSVQVRHALLKANNKRSFLETDAEKRARVISGKFVFIREFIRGKRIALLDDSIVRGLTFMKLVKRLFELGAAEVHVFSLAPKIIASCFYGIDTPQRQKLIAWHWPEQRVKTDAEIAAEIGANSVRFISLPGLYQGVGLPAEMLCHGCITGEYPTPIEAAASKVALRENDRVGC